MKRHREMVRFESGRSSATILCLCAVTHIIQCSCGVEFEGWTEEIVEDMMNKHLKEEK